jgi:hypothetical protein
MNFVQIYKVQTLEVRILPRAEARAAYPGSDRERSLLYHVPVATAFLRTGSSYSGNGENVILWVRIQRRMRVWLALQTHVIVIQSTVKLTANVGFLAIPGVVL